jgi:hypothetical protein
MVVEVTRQIDHESRLLARLDDDVQRLDAQVVRWGSRVAGEADDRAEVHVLA